MTQFHSDYSLFGFSRTEIKKFLEIHGISASLNLPQIDPLRSKFPAWAEELKAKEIFTAWQAASILIGVNPYSPDAENLQYDERFNLAKDLLDEAVTVGKLKAELRNGNYGGNTFAHADLRAWAASVRREWCIPSLDYLDSFEAVSSAPGSNDVVLERLQQSERENAGLQADKTRLTESLEKAHAKIDQQQQQLAEAAEKLISETRSKTEFQSEFDSLKADALEGKTKSTLQRILGGIAMSGCGLDIHANRIDGISQAVSDLALMGVTIKEDTLRKHLKAAAELIPKPK